jgi:nucleoid DNA-binding protein
MNKSQLVEAVAETLGSRRHAADAVDAVLEAIMRAVAAGEQVSIAGFGTFEQVERPARSASTPRAGERAQLETTAIPGFRAGQRFKDVISGTEQSGGGGGYGAEKESYSQQVRLYRSNEEHGKESRQQEGGGAGPREEDSLCETVLGVTGSQRGSREEAMKIKVAREAYYTSSATCSTTIRAHRS